LSLQQSTISSEQFLDKMNGPSFSIDINAGSVNRQILGRGAFDRRLQARQYCVRVRRSLTHCTNQGTISPFRVLKQQFTRLDAYLKGRK
jgi:hypothetical protein